MGRVTCVGESSFPTKEVGEKKRAVYRRSSWLDPISPFARGLTPLHRHCGARPTPPHASVKHFVSTHCASLDYRAARPKVASRPKVAMSFPCVAGRTMSTEMEARQADDGMVRFKSTCAALYSNATHCCAHFEMAGHGGDDASWVEDHLPTALEDVRLIDVISHTVGKRIGIEQKH